MTAKAGAMLKLFSVGGVVLLALIACAVAVPPYIQAKALKGYSGDGHIKDLSVWTPSGYARRYVIEFDQFPLNRDFRKTYYIRGLPRILWSPARVNLRVHVDAERLKTPASQAKVVLAVSADTKPILKFERELSKMRAEEWSNSPGTSEFYDEDNGNVFSPNPATKYEVDVHYIADPTITGVGEFIIDTSGP